MTHVKYLIGLIILLFLSCSCGSRRVSSESIRVKSEGYEINKIELDSVVLNILSTLAINSNESNDSIVFKDGEVKKYGNRIEVQKTESTHANRAQKTYEKEDVIKHKDSVFLKEKETDRKTYWGVILGMIGVIIYLIWKRRN